MSHTCICARVCECACVRMCARVCVNKEKAPCEIFLLTTYSRITYIWAHSTEFLSCGTIHMFLCAGDVAAH